MSFKEDLTHHQDFLFIPENRLEFVGLSNASYFENELRLNELSHLENLIIKKNSLPVPVSSVGVKASGSEVNLTRVAACFDEILGNDRSSILGLASKDLNDETPVSLGFLDKTPFFVTGKIANKQVTLAFILQPEELACTWEEVYDLRRSAIRIAKAIGLDDKQFPEIPHNPLQRLIHDLRTRRLAD